VPRRIGVHSTGAEALSIIDSRSVPLELDLGTTLLAGVGAIGSALVYLADLMPLRGALTLFDRDSVDVSNLNRSPMFTVWDTIDDTEKTAAAAAYHGGQRAVQADSHTGVWRDHVDGFANIPFDVWVSLTNEDGAWAELPFHLPPVVLHGTTTSGWGFGAGRHIPRREDCTLCRMPRPESIFRGPCAEGEVQPATEDRGPVRAALPFLSTAAAALVLAAFLQLDQGESAASLPNDVSADLGIGLPAPVALRRGPTPGCRGCRAMSTPGWSRWGGRGRFAFFPP
jgi:hypothetical protein